MKNIKKLLLVLLISILSVVVLAGCQSVETPDNIQLEGRTITWAAMKNATGYKVKVNEDEFEVSENQFTLPDDYYGTVTISVQAFNEKKVSDYSQTATYTVTLKLSAPTNIAQDGDKIIWDKVERATGYIVKINGSEYLTPINEYAIEISEPMEIQVLAIGSLDEIILSSDYSEIFKAKIVLPAPQGITESDGVLSWNSVNGASSYMVLVNDKDELLANDTSISLKYKYVGEINIKVKAISNDSSYLDSGYTSFDLTLAKLTLPTPQNIDISDGKLTFDKVEGASKYQIYVKGELIDTIESTSYNIPSSVLEDEDSYLQVAAISELHFSSELSQKVVCQVTEISNEQQLKAISYGSYILVNDITLTEEWQPIAEFNGILNGNGFSIKGINITADVQNLGFFGILNKAIVKNITLEGAVNAVINFNSSNIGGLAGKSVESNISNCNINIDIDIKVHNGMGNAGGAIGNIQNSNLDLVHYNGIIKTENCVTGGLVAKADNPEQFSSINQSSVIADIEAIGGEQAYLGGFIGQMLNNMLTISQSKAEVSLIGSNYVGGFVGYMGSGKIENSYSLGNVKAVGDTLVHAGGFIGRLEGYNVSISSSIAICSVVSEKTGNNVLVGGFAGYTVGGNYARVYKDCLYDKSVAPIDRIGNANGGVGDGILSKTTEELQALEYSNAYSSSIWLLGGDAPMLKWEQ